MPLVTTPATQLLESWLRRRLPESSGAWLTERLEAVRGSTGDAELDVSLGFVARKVGKDDLCLDASDMEAASHARSGWDPSSWSLDQAARIVLLLNAPGDDERLARRLERIFTTADIAELVTFYRGLPLYPSPERYVARAQLGVRSNMKAVFTAVAHDNPYPAEQFSEDAWNQMVVKSLFVGLNLSPIQRLDERRNPALARMLRDYAHERWAASRTVNPELWRCVGAFADETMLTDFRRLLASNDPAERRAGEAALAESSLTL